MAHNEIKLTPEQRAIIHKLLETQVTDLMVAEVFDIEAVRKLRKLVAIFA